MMPGLNFGLYLSRDRFKNVLRFWAVGPDGTEDKLTEKPWEEVDYWVRAFNNKQKEKLVVGTDLTPDELMIAWKGEKAMMGFHICHSWSGSSFLWAVRQKWSAKRAWACAFLLNRKWCR